MKLLELFKGTGSIGKVFKQLYPNGEIVSVDIRRKYEPTFCGDIMDFDYKRFKEGHFDFIWASPECKVYSSLAFTNVGANRCYKTKQDLMDVHEINSIYVKRVIEMIEYLKPKYYFIENPYNSHIKKYIDFPFYRFDYCRFGYEYQKPTKIWTNKTLESMKCNCETKPHKRTIGWSTNQPTGRNTTSINQRYSIPPALVKYLLE
jgi:hypothetical protein